MKNTKQKLVLNFSIEFETHNNDVDGFEQKELTAITPDIQKYLERQLVGYKWYGLQVKGVQQTDMDKTLSTLFGMENLNDNAEVSKIIYKSLKKNNQL